MFSNLTDFSTQRSGSQAFGFYLVFVAGGFLAGALAGGLGAIATGATTFEAGAAAGRVYGVVGGVLYTLVLGGLLCVQKNLALSYYFVAGGAGLLAMVGGTILGLIPVAWLTTRPSGASETDGPL